MPSYDPAPVSTDRDQLLAEVERLEIARDILMPLIIRHHAPISKLVKSITDLAMTLEERTRR